jgi:UPF0755 protein
VLAITAPVVSVLYGWNGPAPARRSHLHRARRRQPAHAGSAASGSGHHLFGARLPRARTPAGHPAGIKAGEFLLPKGASEKQILQILTGDEALRRFVTVPEGLPSIMVREG